MSQQEVFVSKVVPSLFHTTPEDFIRYLDQDGTKFLRFYWDQAAKDPQIGQPTTALGLNYDIRQPFSKTTVVLITLPRPTTGKGSYFIAAIYRPTRRTPFLGISDVTKVITLEGSEDAQGNIGTTLVEWSRKLVPEPLSPGPEPRLEDFYLAVCELVKP